MKVKVRSLGGGRPIYKTEQAAGADLIATHELHLVAGGIGLVGTGIAIELPEGYEAQIRPRSGLALAGITVLNAPGTIDADYRGEIRVILVNHSGAPYRVTPGQRVAQLVIAPVTRAEFELVSGLNETERGAGGFGSTGA